MQFHLNEVIRSLEKSVKPDSTTLSILLSDLKLRTIGLGQDNSGDLFKGLNEERIKVAIENIESL